MKPKIKNYASHLFICTNASGCAFLGGQKLRDQVKSKLLQRLGVENFKRLVRVNNTGCLGDCSEGVAACMYPQNRHWTNLTENDTDLLVEHVLKELEL